MAEALRSLLSNDLAMTCVVAAGSLLAVWVPFYRALKIGLVALSATRRIENRELARGLQRGLVDADEPLALLTLRVLGKSLRENRESHPSEFIVDATKQYALNEFEGSFSRPISMYANVLPPIGFIGTTGGLLILFLSMRVASDSLELGALAMALTSSLFALVGFTILEGFKIRLYRRALAAVQDAFRFYRAVDSRGPAGDSGRPGLDPASAASSAS